MILEEQDAALIRQILSQHVPGLPVFAFGSRVTGKARKFSDLDLYIKTGNKLPSQIIDDLKDAFSESDLPIRVDVLDWHAVSPEFQKIIDTQAKIFLFE